MTSIKAWSKSNSSWSAWTDREVASYKMSEPTKYLVLSKFATFYSKALTKLFE